MEQVETEVSGGRKIRYSEICIKIPNVPGCVSGESFMTFAMNNQGVFDVN